MCGPAGKKGELTREVVAEEKRMNEHRDEGAIFLRATILP